MTYQYSPATLHLADIEQRLTPLKIPIYYKLPTSDVLEPFMVIGTTSSSMHPTALQGRAIEAHSVQIDVFVPGDSRTVAEEVKARVIRLLGRNTSLQANLLMDDSVGREVYHIVVNFTENIL